MGEIKFVKFHLLIRIISQACKALFVAAAET